MSRRLALLVGAVVVLGSGGAVTASALMDLPQDAQSVTADLNRQQATQPLPSPPAAAPVEGAPAGGPAPSSPIAITPPATEIDLAAVEEDLEAETEELTPPPAPVGEPGRRQRRRVAVVQAVNKITAQSMRFAVEVNGRPVRFSDNLIISARACESTAPDEVEEDSIAYLEIGLLPRGVIGQTSARQIYRGWMFASTPAVHGLEHPLYDAWVVECRA